MEIFPGGGAPYYILQVGVAGGLSSGIFSVQIYNNFKLENVAPAVFFFAKMEWIIFDKSLKKCLPAFALPFASSLLGPAQNPQIF